MPALTQHIILGIIHYGGEVLQRFLVYVIQSLGNCARRAYLIRNIRQKVLRHFVVGKEMQPLHRMPAL